LKKAGAQEPSGDPAHKKIGNVSMDDVVDVALMKKPSMTSRSLKSSVKSILGTAKSIGLTVENKDPKDLVKEVDEGKYDDLLSKYEEKWNKGA
jgi:large subunit ribosomal protein L11